MSWRDYALIEGRWFHWPMCKIPGCGNRMNRAANNGLCWPHQPSGKTLEEIVNELGRDQEVPALV